jgi:hypothetical protein
MGVKRTFIQLTLMSAFDPKLTSPRGGRSVFLGEPMPGKEFDCEQSAF